MTILSRRITLMPRLIVQPGTPHAWEIQLKPGLNFLGRGPENDFKIEDPSVSTSHCQIRITDGSALITDMGSTNGTFVKGAKILEFPLHHGQQFRLGSVDVIYYSDASDAARAIVVPEAVAMPASAIQMPPLPPSIRSTAPISPPPRPPLGLRLSAPAPSRESIPVAAPIATVAIAPPPIPPASPPLPPPVSTGAPASISGTKFCKFHPKVPARFFCKKCNRTFCELCVIARESGSGTVHMCRTCAVECVPVRFQRAAPKSFSSKLPAAFIYPFEGAGIIVLVCATVALAALDFIIRMFGIFGWAMAVTFYGFLFLFMQNILHTTTSDETESIGFPDPSSLSTAAFQLGMTILASFWLFIALTIAKLFYEEIPVEALIASAILGGVYFPMAFLAVAMKDSTVAANPLIVIPAIMKVPGQYAVTVVLLLAVFAVRKGGDLLSGAAGSEMIHTTHLSMLLMAMFIKSVLGLISVYLLTVTMRILGLFYNSCKDQLDWFSH